MTGIMKKMFCLGVLLSGLLILAQCATVCKEPITPLPGLATKRALSEIGSLEEIADKNSEPSVRARADLELARLYSSYKNPRPDYRQALRRLELYLSFYPAEGGTDEMQNWLSLLEGLVKGRDEIRKSAQTIDQLTKENKGLTKTGEALERQNKELTKDNEDLARDNEALAKDNKDLKETVKELQNIDIKMEEKRKQIK